MAKNAVLADQRDPDSLHISKNLLPALAERGVTLRSRSIRC
jgi:hypothetical protein